MSSSSTKVNVLHIDDEEDVLFYSKTLLEEFEPQLNITNVHTPTELYAELDTGKYDLVLSDYRMPEINGIELGEKVKTRYAVPFILYTGQGSEEVAEKAFGVGIDDYLRKENEPAHYQVLAKRVMQAVEMTRTLVEVKRRERQLMALHEHSWRLGMASSVEIVSEITLNILNQVLGFAYASFHLVEDENLRVVDSHGASTLIIVRPLNGAGVTARVARTGKSALIPDTRCEPDFVATSTPTLSELAVPVMSDGVVYAVLNVESEMLNAFTENDRQLMELLASHIASAMNRLRVTEEERTQREEYEHRLAALHTHSQELNTAQNPTDVSKSTLKIMVETLKYPNTSFHLFEDDALITASVTGQSLRRLRLPLNGKGITVRVARTGQTALIGDTRLDPDYVQGPVEALSELAVPAVSQGKVVGVLNTESVVLNAFSENDRRLVELLAGHVASALSRIALRDVEKINRERYEKNLVTRQLQTASVLNAANKLNEATSLEEVMDITINTLKHDFTIDNATFAQVKNESITFLRAIDIEIPPNSSIPPTRKTVLTRVVKTRKTQRIEDVRLDPDYIFLGSNSGFLSELAVPILVDGEVRALINIENKALGRFTESDQSLVELLAESIASAYKRIEQDNRVKALRQGTQSIIAVNSIEELSKITFQTIQSVLGYDYVTLALVEGDNLVHRHSLGWNSSEMIILPLDGPGITVKAAVTGKSQLVNDVRLNPDYVYSRQGADITLSELAVPVKTTDNVVAVINVESKTEHAFTKNDQTILEILANNISSMLTRLTAQNKEKASRNRYENSLVTRQLQTAAILNAANRLNEATSLENVAEITLETLSEFEFNFAVFSIVETDSIIVKKSIGAKIPSGSSFLLTGKTVLSRAVNTRLTQRIEDIRLDPDYTSLAPDIGFRSELAVPILVEGEVKAVINIEDKTVGWFTAEDQTLMEMLAESISSTLKRLKQDKIIQTLNQSTLKMNFVSSIQELSKVSFQTVHDVLGYDFASLAFVEEENLIHRYNSGWNKPEIVTLPLDGPGISVKAAITGKNQIVNDVRLNPDYVHRDNKESLSELALPIKIGDKVVAVLNIGSKTKNAFSSNDLLLLEIIIQSLTSTLTRLNAQESENMNREQNESQLIEHQRKITLILNASNKLNEAVTLENVVNYTLDVMKSDFALDWAGFAVVENGLLVYKKVNDVELPDTSIPLSRKTVTTRAIKTRKTQRVEDVRLDPDYISLGSNEGFLSELAVPIMVDGEVKALINIEGKTVGQFTVESQSLVELLAESVSSALKRLEQNNRIEVLHQGSHEMNHVNSIEELSKASFQTIYDILGFDSGSLAVIEGENLIHRFSFGWNSPDAISMPLTGPGITVRAAVTRESQLVNDVRLDPSYIYLHQIDDPSLSELAVPVIIGDKVVGVINVESKVESAFTENDRVLLEIIAHNISAAMELLKSREQELMSNKRQFDSLLENVESHGRGIRQSLRIPLQTLTNAAYLMLKRPERSEKYYDVITDNVSYCNEILEELWVNVKADDLALQRVDLSELLDLSLVGVLGVERVQVARVSLGKVSLIADEAKMKRVLHGLLQNAVDAMPEGGVLTVAADVSSSGVMITVQDTGVGISKQSMVKLFTPFYTTKSNGTGLGLSMCKQVVEAHGGSIRIESEEGVGCSVEVCLPISAMDRSIVSSRE